jgi:hypothetical protein
MSGNPLPQDRRGFTGYTSIEQVEEAFWSKVDIQGPDDCWPWTGSATQRHYGQFSSKAFPITTLAHRWAFYFAYGRLPEPEGAHSCDFGLCCNPHHIHDATRLQNEQEKDERGRRPRGVTTKPCGACGGPREGRARRSSGREFAFCIPCKKRYLVEYRRGGS